MTSHDDSRRLGWIVLGFFIVILLAGVLTGAKAAGAQDVRYGKVPEGLYAVTDCTPQGTPETIVSPKLLTDTADLQEVLVHEAVHRQQYAARPELCKGLTDMQSLVMELQAYCVSATVRVQHGHGSHEVFFDYLERLDRYFYDKFPAPFLGIVWYHECAKTLLTPPDGTTVTGGK